MPLVRSLRARVVLWVCVALIVVFAATIVGLDIVFRNSTDSDRRDLLEAHVLGLIALAEPGPGDELRMPTEAVDAHFEVPNSGLYGALYDANGRALWQSLSLLSLAQTIFPLKPALAALSIAFFFASLQASLGFGGLRDPAAIVLVASTFIVVSASSVVGDTIVMSTNTVVEVMFISISLSSKRRKYALPPLDGSGNSRCLD